MKIRVKVDWNGYGEGWMVATHSNYDGDDLSLQYIVVIFDDGRVAFVEPWNVTVIDPEYVKQ